MVFGQNRVDYFVQETNELAEYQLGSSALVETHLCRASTDTQGEKHPASVSITTGSPSVVVHLDSSP
jgi:hypothetical protein